MPPNRPLVQRIDELEKKVYPTRSKYVNSLASEVYEPEKQLKVAVRDAEMLREYSKRQELENEVLRSIVHDYQEMFHDTTIADKGLRRVQ